MIVLKRHGSTPFGTFGTLKLPGKGRSFCTIERPWKNNTPYESCVPLGTYKLLWLPTTTPVPMAFNNHTWYLVNDNVGLWEDGKVRSNCSLHIANLYTDVNGCIGAGTAFGTVKGKWGVTNSRSALEALYEACGPKDQELVIFSTLMG